MVEVAALGFKINENDPEKVTKEITWKGQKLTVTQPRVGINYFKPGPLLTHEDSL